MADQNTTQLTEQTNPVSTDLLYTVGDPGGTPVDRKITLSLAQTHSIVAGETVAVGQDLYVKASDGRAYKAVATGDESTYSFIGIAASAGNAADSICYWGIGSIATGVASGTIGQTAYIGDTAGTVAAAPGTRYAAIGLWVAATSIEIRSPQFIRSGSFTVTGTGNTSVTTGFYPRKIRIRGFTAGTGGSDGDGDNTCMYWDGADVSGTVAMIASRCAISVVNSSTYLQATVSAKSQTGFTFNTDLWSTQNTTIYWNAEN